MPNTTSAAKAMRAAERKHFRNQVYRSRSRTFLKRARVLIGTGRLEEAKEAVQKASSELDRAAQKGVIHKGNAARRKSRLARMLNKALAAG